MDISGLASAFVGMKAAELQMAAAAKMMKMNADASGAIAQVLDAAQNNMQRLAYVATGIGTNLDITA